MGSKKYIKVYDPNRQPIPTPFNARYREDDVETQIELLRQQHLLTAEGFNLQHSVQQLVSKHRKRHGMNNKYRNSK